MRALVTGGLGFIGSHVVDLLVPVGLDVLVVDNLSTGSRAHSNPAATYRVEDLEGVPRDVLHGFDYVFHLAALPRIQPSFEDPIGHEQANVVATLELVMKLVGSRNLKKLVLSSSSALYGNPRELPTSEDAPPDPLSPYAVQKYAAEAYALLLGDRYGVPTIGLRYFNVYGPRSFNPRNPFNAYSSVVGIFAEQKRGGRPLTITGTGEQRRDFVHVRDAARANWLAAVSPVPRGVYNVGCGSPISILDLAKRFHHPYEFIPERKGEARVTWADIRRIGREVGWSPGIGLEEGVAELCAG